MHTWYIFKQLFNIKRYESFDTWGFFLIMKKQYFILLCFLLLTTLLSAQTAAELERILGGTVSYEQAAYFVLEAADVQGYSGSQSPSDAFNFALSRKWVPANVSGTNNATIDAAALLVMGSFGIKGGLFYSMLKNQHYAYRELVYKDIIQGRTDPKTALSGDYLLFMISRALAYTQGYLEE